MAAEDREDRLMPIGSFDRLKCGDCGAKVEVAHMTRPQGWSAVNVTTFWTDGKDAVVCRVMLCDKCTPTLVKKYPFGKETD